MPSPQAAAVIRLARPEGQAPPLYSHAERVVGAKVPPVAPAAQVRRTLLNAGVKPEEMKWSGLDARLAAAEAAGEPVRRADLVGLVRENTPELEEHVYGGVEYEPHLLPIGRTYTDPEYDEETGEEGPSLPLHTYEDKNSGETFEVVHDGDAGNVYVTDRDGNRLDVEALTGFGLNDQSVIDAENAINEHLRQKYNRDAGEPVSGPARYGKYQLPGGENYRERLFALPPGEPHRAVPAEYGYDVYDAAGRRYGTYNAGSPEEAVERARRNGPTDSAAVFRSSHWDEPNVLFHVRHSDRTGPNGEKLLHIEELQSDHHQQGRDKGYKPAAEEVAAMAAEKAALDARRREIERLVEEKAAGHRDRVARGGWANFTDEWNTRNLLSQYDTVQHNLRLGLPMGGAVEGMSDRVKADLGPLAAEYDAARDRRDELIRKLDRADEGVPDAPFKKTWHELALRKMIDHAARNGYAGVTWTPGQEHADRYDLSQHIDEIDYAHNPDGTVTWSAGKNGANVLTKYNHTPAELEAHLGKEVAGRVMANAGEREPGEPASSGVLRGLDLKTGGEGMKGFYDRIVPQYLDKYGKRFGAAVGTTTIDAGERGRVAVPHFPITPALRDAVHTEGQVLYSRSPAALAVIRLAARQHPGEVGTPTTRWVDRPAPANPAAAVVHPGVIFPRVKVTTAPTLRPDLTVAAAPDASAFEDKNVRHHREKAAVYDGMRLAGLPAGGGPAGDDLRDYVMTLARGELTTNPEWADRYRTAAARLAADEVPAHFRDAVAGAVADLVRTHAADPGLVARAERVKAATAAPKPVHPIAPGNLFSPDADSPGIAGEGPAENLFPLLPPPAGDLPPLPTAKRPPAFGSPATPAVERRLGTDGDVQLVDDLLHFDPSGRDQGVPPARDLPPLPLAGTPRGRKKGTPFDVQARRQFLADQFAAGKDADAAAAALRDRYGLSPGEAARAVARFRGLSRPPVGRVDPPLALSRLREAVLRYAKTKGRTKKQCRNKRCKRTFLSSGPQHRYCSPACRLSSDPGYRDGYVRGRSKAAPAPAPRSTPESATPEATKLSRLRGLLKRYAKVEDTAGRQAAAKLLSDPGVTRVERNQIDRELRTPAVMTPRLDRDLTPLETPDRKQYVTDLMGGRGIIPQVWGVVGGKAARVSAYDPNDKKLVKTNLVGRTLEQFVAGGGHGGTPLVRLGDDTHSWRVRAARAIAQGVDEPQHQLAKGLDESGVQWYERDLKRLDAGLIALYGERTPQGGYRGRFGEVNARGEVEKRTPHLKLFKVLLGGLSPNMNPVDNLNLAVHLYETARQAHPGQNPLAVLPPHKGINRATGEYQPEWAYLPNDKLSWDDAVAAGLKPEVNAQGRVQGNTLYLSPKVAVDSYHATRRLLAKVLERFGGDEAAAADFFLDPMPLKVLERYKSKALLHKDLPRPYELPDDYGYHSRDGQDYHGAWLLGPKAGPFVLNVNYHNGMITKDLWFSRSWNRLMGTLTSGPKHKLQDVPRGPDERRAMDESVYRMAETLGLTPSELQATWWYYEQGLYRAMAGKAESNSFADAINRHLAGKVPLTRALSDEGRKAKLPDPKLKSAEEARRRAAVARAQATPLHYARSPVPRDPRGDQFPRPPREVFEDLRTDADRLLSEGRMPTAEEFLDAIVAEAKLRGAGPHAAGHAEE